MFSWSLVKVCLSSCNSWMIILLQLFAKHVRINWIQCIGAGWLFSVPPPVIMSDEVMTCRLMKIIILWRNQLYLNLDLFSWRQGGSAFIPCYSSPLAGAGRRISPPDTQFRRIAALKLWFWFNNSQYSFKTKISVNINCFYSILFCLQRIVCSL